MRICICLLSTAKITTRFTWLYSTTSGRGLNSRLAAAAADRRHVVATSTFAAATLQRQTFEAANYRTVMMALDEQKAQAQYQTG